MPKSQPIPNGVVTPLQEVIDRAVLEALTKCHGNVVLTAKLLGVGKTTLYRWIKEWRVVRLPGDPASEVKAE